MLHIIFPLFPSRYAVYIFIFYIFRNRVLSNHTYTANVENAKSKEEEKKCGKWNTRASFACALLKTCWMHSFFVLFYFVLPVFYCMLCIHNVYSVQLCAVCIVYALYSELVIFFYSLLISSIHFQPCSPTTLSHSNQNLNEFYRELAISISSEIKLWFVFCCTVLCCAAPCCALLYLAYSEMDNFFPVQKSTDSFLTLEFWCGTDKILSYNFPPKKTHIFYALWLYFLHEFTRSHTVNQSMITLFTQIYRLF